MLIINCLLFFLLALGPALASVSSFTQSMSEVILFGAAAGHMASADKEKSMTLLYYFLFSLSLSLSLSLSFSVSVSVSLSLSLSLGLTDFSKSVGRNSLQLLNLFKGESYNPDQVNTLASQLLDSIQQLSKEAEV